MRINEPASPLLRAKYAKSHIDYIKRDVDKPAPVGLFFFMLASE
jgi:hypothetical protein